MSPAWLRLLGAGAAIALALGWTALAYRMGARAEGATVRAAWQAERTASARQLADATERALRAQQDLGAALALRDQQHQQELDHVQIERDGLRDRLRSGAVRVSVPARVPTCQPGPDGDHPVALPDQARAELDPAFAQDLVRITSDGDSAIVDLNACIDRYNAVRASVTALSATHDAQTP